ncbi:MULTISPECIES: peroxiredoxin [Dehalococcoides]|jgi:peroxiredoxin (alkyl hydroperoxide reductase subunit C)|uniref:Peroxiredoxin n=3 Tax=Dehalococcoides mccartyi TaxID=61435 RepID=A0A1S7AW76_9CHLR|nr:MULTISPECIES: peroxiredoxin [Dehalococcoides]AGG07057.1 peroxiredoxin-like protein [Dehalococcoides mccartyi DCMB5]AQX73879.1 peroxiredoxin [Dehalococcoides mccartyi]RAL69900.1 putative peroxiredoxin [Dehalococcoides mccartyi]RAL71080.1 putative peroxiredoxin [Dehalococcoides mccartyi]CAI83679.1 antioxidant, AhpC [Dehalococcoides mccartyi CBDB1]
MEEVARAMPRIGDIAPQFEALTTHGVLKLEDFKGQWLIIFSHPADFTPVCTTEFIAFTEIYPELQKRGVELLGLSVDSNSSHIAWVRNVEEKTGIKIPFPIIADLNKEVSSAYGMLHPGQSKTETVRCVFILDPGQKIRLIMYYPMNVGRNMQEILRVIDALQTADEYKVALPANWYPGDKVVVPSPSTQEMAEERMGQGYECVDWYLCKKQL